jgi:hypothetical protein
MTRSKSILFVLCLTALVSCAFVASNASAMTMHECKKISKGGTGVRYSDSNCTIVNGAGAFQTETLPQGETVEVTPTSTQTFVLSATISAIKFEFHCEAAIGSAKTTNTIEKGSMMVLGTGQVTLQGCTVLLPEAVGCTVPAEIKTTELKLETSEMKTTYLPQEGTTLTTVNISGCEGAAKALNGERKVTGKLVAVSEEVPASQEFTATSGSEAEISGAPAVFTGKLHYATKANGATISLETP